MDAGGSGCARRFVDAGVPGSLKTHVALRRPSMDDGVMMSGHRQC